MMMKKYFAKLFLTVFMISLTSFMAHAKETRCGWYINPTPGNHWLMDKDGEWVISTQGGHQAGGEAFPEFSEKQWVATQASYGYGCACLDVEVQVKDDVNYISKIFSAKVKDLSVCKRDKTLKEPSQ